MYHLLFFLFSRSSRSGWSVIIRVKSGIKFIKEVSFLFICRSCILFLSFHWRSFDWIFYSFYCDGGGLLCLFFDFNKRLDFSFRAFKNGLFW